MASSTLRVVERVALGLGAAALIYAAGTAAYADVTQRRLSQRFERETTTAAAGDLGADVVRPIALHDGDVVGRLEIPSVGISVMVLQGVDQEMLVVGAGHVPGTSLPGGDGNVAIAAHRDTYFRTLEGIRPGDGIHVETVRGTYAYVVDSTEIVDPADTRPISSRARPELTLITCYPFYFVGPAPRRFIVHALPLK
jgi:sortase A